MIFAALALALAAAPAPTAGTCALLNLAACADASGLARDAGFKGALKAFVGQGRTGYLSPNGRAYDEALAVLSGPAEPARKLRSLYVFTACADAACDDQGAVVLQPDGELVAMAILHTDCNSVRRTGDCLSRQVLSIFRRGDDFSVVDALSDWARKSFIDRPLAPGTPIKSLDRVEVIPLNGPAPKLETEPAVPALDPATRIPAQKPIVRPNAAPAPPAFQYQPAFKPAPIPLPEPARPPPVQPAPVQSPEPAPAPAKSEPAPSPAAEPASAEPPSAAAAPGGVTAMSGVTAIAPTPAARVPIPLKVYLTLKTDIPSVAVLPPPPPPPPPPKDKRKLEMWKWRWTPYGY